MDQYNPVSLDLLQLNDPRKQYLNLVELYYRPWDVLTELIQNSLASIFEAQKTNKTLAGSIKVTIDADAKTVTVEDNGVGFSSLSDLGANRTTRGGENGVPYSGFGLGASSIIARSNLFEVRSVNIKKELHSAKWINVFTKIGTGETDINLEPETCEGPVTVSGASRTVITVGGEGFAGLWLEAEKPDRLYEIIMAHTALGYTSNIWGDPASRPNCRYSVIIKRSDQNVVNKVGQTLGFPYVEVGTAGTFDYDEYSRMGTVPDKDKLIIYKKKGRVSANRDYKLNLYIACEVERGTLIKSRFGQYLEDLATNRILLSVDGFLQSFPIDRPAERGTRALWGNVFVIVDASDNIVEPGRNKIADLYIQQVNKELKDAVGLLDSLVSKMREKEETRYPINVDEAKKDAETNSVSNPLSYAINADLHLLKVPADEQEVIALFFELLGHGFIEGCDVYRVGASSVTYDAYLRFRYKYEDVGEKARPGRDEGKRSLDLNRDREKTLVTEFKTTSEKLVIELQGGNTRKQLKHINLLICWEEGVTPAGYSLDPLEDDYRFFSAATHVLRKNGGSEDERCEVMLLSTFLENLEANSSASS